MRAGYPTLLTQQFTGGSNFDVMAWNCALTSTGVRGKVFSIEYEALASTQDGLNSSSYAEARLTITMELFRDGELQEMYIDVLSAQIGGSPGVTRLNTQAGSTAFTTQEE